MRHNVADLAEAEAAVERPIEHDDLLGESILEEEEFAVQQQVMSFMLQVLCSHVRGCSATIPL